MLNEEIASKVTSVDQVNNSGLTTGSFAEPWSLVHEAGLTPSPRKRKTPEKKENVSSKVRTPVQEKIRRMEEWMATTRKRQGERNFKIKKYFFNSFIFQTCRGMMNLKSSITHLLVEPQCRRVRLQTDVLQRDLLDQLVSLHADKIIIDPVTLLPSL